MEDVAESAHAARSNSLRTESEIEMSQPQQQIPSKMAKAQAILYQVDATPRQAQPINDDLETQALASPSQPPQRIALKARQLPQANHENTLSGGRANRTTGTAKRRFYGEYDATAQEERDLLQYS